MRPLSTWIGLSGRSAATSSIERSSRKRKGGTTFTSFADPARSSSRLRTGGYRSTTSPFKRAATRLCRTCFTGPSPTRSALSTSVVAGTGWNSSSTCPMPMFESTSPRMAGEIRGAYERVAQDGESAVAVRSSATAEDLAEASFAGQQETYLNVRGAEALLGAVKRCWASLWTARAMAYRARQGIDPATVSLAVVVQRMVKAEAAGVMFTANPANGRRDQAALSAAWGLGESVVSGAVTPDSIVVEKESGRVISREIADKEVMTVYTEAGTEKRPVPEGRRLQSVLDDERAAELARYGAQIEELYGTPQDIEWALADGEFAIVQSRPITALPEPMADPPTDWSVPETGGMYARASIVEQMPDPLSPLFADLIEGSVVRSLQKLMDELLGADALREGDLGF